MDISVVIPCHNMADTLGRAIDSAEQARAGEIVVVTDGETDINVVPQILKSNLMFGGPRVGVCGARNIGIQTAENNLIVPLDADDELLPDSLQILQDAWQPGTLVYGGWIENDTYHEPPPPEMLARKNVAHATWLFHKDDWKRVGGYHPDFNIGGEDWAFMLALANAGVTPVRVNTPIYRKYTREDSRTGRARARAFFINNLVREHYPALFRPRAS